MRVILLFWLGEKANKCCWNGFKWGKCGPIFKYDFGNGAVVVKEANKSPTWQKKSALIYSWQNDDSNKTGKKLYKKFLLLIL
jgi:hypothetical protein